MTLYAIFSDVHGNTRALEHILRYLRSYSVDGYLQLGDLGVEPLALLDGLPVRHVFGNWEVSSLPRFPHERQPEVAAWPPFIAGSNWLAAHATPIFPQECNTLEATRSYMRQHRLRWTQLFPSLLHDEKAIWAAFAELAQRKLTVAFHGHTHVQAVQQLGADNRLRRITDTTIRLEPDTLTLVGVGSAGVPRDGLHPRCVLFDDVGLELRLLTIPLP
ncbi:MAG: metallophosphoesterase [Caldilineae bacterium]|nr:MAG: metallophosphoesterase [Caldilineae bacterium]